MRRPILLKTIIPFSLIWPSRMCHNWVDLESVKRKFYSIIMTLEESSSWYGDDFAFTSVIAAEPVTVEPCRIFKMATFYLFIKTSAPWDTCKSFDSMMILQPFESRKPKEMRFLFESGTCLTYDNVLIIPSYILIWMVLMPIILQGE